MTQFTELPDDEQVSNDFGLFTDGSYYYAVRAASEGNCNFIVKDKSKWIVISDAVEAIANWILSNPEIKPVPYWNEDTGLIKWQ